MFFLHYLPAETPSHRPAHPKQHDVTLLGRDLDCTPPPSSVLLGASKFHLRCAIHCMRVPVERPFEVCLHRQLPLFLWEQKAITSYLVFNAAVSNLIASLSTETIFTSQVYEELFEGRFLRETSEFYAAEGVRYMATADVPHFLQHVEERLQQVRAACFFANI